MLRQSVRLFVTLCDPVKKDANADDEIFTVSSGKETAARICNGFQETWRGSSRSMALNSVGNNGDFQPVSRRKTVRDWAKVNDH